MTFTQYKTDFYQKWQRRMKLYSLFGALFVFLVDIGVSVYCFFNQSVLAPTTFDVYLFTEILIPVILNLILLPLEFILLRTKKYAPGTCNRICCYTLYTQLSIVAIFHSRYQAALIIPALIMVFAALLADRRLLRALFFSTLSTEFIALAMFFTKQISGNLFEKIINSFLVISTHIAIYFISRSLFTFQKKQLHYVYESFSKMRQMTVELRLEPLTRLYNRTAYADAIERYIKLANEKNAEIIQVLLDLDNFKTINDSYGHAAGDVVLITLADIITKQLGTNRSAFRYGGDEFVILFKDKTMEEVEKIIDEIRVQFAEYEFDFIGTNFHCSMSIGIASFKKDMNGKAWFKAADDAAYEAKLKGKNCYVVAE